MKWSDMMMVEGMSLVHVYPYDNNNILKVYKWILLALDIMIKNDLKNTCCWLYDLYRAGYQDFNHCMKTTPGDHMNTWAKS